MNHPIWSFVLTVIAFVATGVVAEPTVSGSTISWPDDGWYQVQDQTDYSSVCEGGSSCEVSAGTYVVINHTTGDRFQIEVTGDTNGLSDGPAGGFVFSRTDIDEYRYVIGTGNVWIDSSCASELGGSSRSGTWSDLNAIAPYFDSITNPCSSDGDGNNGGGNDNNGGDNSGGSPGGFVFSRTDTDEFRYVMGNGNVWIDGACAESLGGASQSGTWSDLNAIAPNFDSIANPCASGGGVNNGGGNDNGGGDNDGGSAEGFVFERTDTDEYRYVMGTGNVWINTACVEQLGGATRSGTWSDLIAIAPDFDSIANPCSSETQTAPMAEAPMSGDDTLLASFVFARTDTDEFRYVMGDANVWIDAVCASELGGATRSGTWSDLASIAPNFDSLDNPCQTNQPTAEPEPATEPAPTPEPSPSDFSYGDVWFDSPYDHSGSEISTAVNTPIQYERIFDRERELFGYNPRFMPGRTYFDKFNLPWIYTSNNNQLDLSDPANPYHVDPITGQPTGRPLHTVTYDDRVYGESVLNGQPCGRCDNYIVRLTREGRWVYFSLDQMALEFGFDPIEPRSIFDFRSSVREGEQLYFRSNGDVFVKTYNGILIYDESENSWSGVKKGRIGVVTLMVGDGDSPPVVISTNIRRNAIWIHQFRNKDDYTAGMSSNEIIIGTGLDIDAANPAAVVHGDFIHIGMMSTSNTAYGRQDRNTAQIYVRANLVTLEATEHFMGWSGNNSFTDADNHNKPSMLLDNDGYLHFISGAHSHYIWHRRSLSPITFDAWQGVWENQANMDDFFTPGPMQSAGEFYDVGDLQTGVDYIGGRNPYTYTQAVVTSDNKIHVVLRSSYYGADRIPSALVYFRGEPLGNGDYAWSERQSLVVPKWTVYSNYLHRLHADRHSNLYLTYTYEVQGLDLGQWWSDATQSWWNTEVECAAQSSARDCAHVVDEHNRRWPNEPLSYGHWAGQNYPHDPVLLGSQNGGSTWQLISTEMLRSAVQSANIANVVRR